ncbi:hypothetical protein ATCC90586_004464 [Pythium insidiosum]|nr:hypothetical protein ATCC90586_004464 [Pythium insidiosum]
MTRVFGLDLGSQRCVVAASSGDVVLNELGGMTTATLLSFKGDERLVGEAAVLSSSTNPQNTVDFVNLLLGKSLADVQARHARVPGHRPAFAHEPALGYGSGAVAVVDYARGEQRFSTEQLAAMLLGKLAQQMRRQLQADDEPFHVNLAVPSGWGDAERRALLFAAKIAGIPSASVLSRDAALARCFHRKHPLEAADAEAKRHILIVDMGHTSTSVAVVELSGESVLSSSCDLQLGSENFDLRLYEHFKAEIEAALRLSLAHHGKEGKRLLQACEKLKKLLSTIAEAAVTVENIAQDRDYTLKTTREVFERLCAADAQRLHALVASALSSAAIDAGAVASVEIVGGGTRIPFVQAALLSALGDRADAAQLIGRMLDSTTAVAVGAAFCDATATDEPVLSAEELAALETLRHREAEMQDRDAELAAIAHERNAIEAFVYEMRGKRGAKHSDKLDEAALAPLLEAAEDWIYSEEAETATLEAVRAKRAQLQRDVEAACRAYFAAVAADEQALEAQLEAEARKAEMERAAEGGGDDHDQRKLKKPERMRLVVKNKDEGNTLFRDGNHQHAALRYIKALGHTAKFFDLTPADEDEVKQLKLSLHLNLAQCYLKLEQWPKAIANCGDALALDAANPKALYRRALAFEKEKNLEAAAADVRAALASAPEDKAILKLDERLKLLLKRQLDKEKKMWSRAFA